MTDMGTGGMYLVDLYQDTHAAATGSPVYKAHLVGRCRLGPTPPDAIYVAHESTDP